MSNSIYIFWKLNEQLYPISILKFSLFGSSINNEYNHTNNIYDTSNHFAKFHNIFIVCQCCLTSNATTEQNGYVYEWNPIDTKFRRCWIHATKLRTKFRSRGSNYAKRNEYQWGIRWSSDNSTNLKERKKTTHCWKATQHENHRTFMRKNNTVKRKQNVNLVLLTRV